MHIGHFIAFQTHRMYNTKTGTNVNYRLWVIMVHQCRLINFTQMYGGLYTDKRGSYACMEAGIQGNLYFSVKFFRPFKCSLKKETHNKKQKQPQPHPQLRGENSRRWANRVATLQKGHTYVYLLYYSITDNFTQFILKIIRL